jgi:hypothetical protein
MEKQSQYELFFMPVSPVLSPVRCVWQHTLSCGVAPPSHQTRDGCERRDSLRSVLGMASPPPSYHSLTCHVHGTRQLYGRHLCCLPRLSACINMKTGNLHKVSQPQGVSCSAVAHSTSVWVLINYSNAVVDTYVWLMLRTAVIPLRV